MNPIRTLVDTSQFQVGVVAGLWAFVLVAVSSIVGARVVPGRRPPPFAGLALAAASLFALDRASGAVPSRPAIMRGLIAGTVLCALAGLAVLVSRRVAVIAFAAAPGAVVTAGAIGGVPTWVRVVAAVFCALGGALVADFDDRHASSGLGPVLTLITVGAIYSTVPDTEAARTVLGVALVVAFVGWPWPIARLGVGGSIATWSVVAFVIGQDGVARPGSIVGAVGAIGVLGIEPVIRAVAGDARNRLDEPRFEAVLRVSAVHLICALGAARFAGLAESAGVALVRLAFILPFAVVLVYWARPADDICVHAGRRTRRA